MPNVRIQKIFFAGVLLAISLIVLGRLLVPSEKAVGLLSALAVLGLYALAGWFVPPILEKSNPAILTGAIRFGLLAGLIFAGEIILEYILLPKDNTIYGLIEFGSVFLVYFLSGTSAAVRTSRIRDGVIASLWTSIISTLIWGIMLLAVFYLFRGTPQQTQVFLAEGNYADFSRSGLKDFNTYIMDDFMGAVSYHSVLGPLIAVILGSLGGFISKGIRKIGT